MFAKLLVVIALVVALLAMATEAFYGFGYGGLYSPWLYGGYGLYGGLYGGLFGGLGLYGR